MELLETHNIRKAFKNHLALDDVSLSVKEGSIFGLLGPNGAGKTTMIRIINQIIAPDRGEIFFQNQRLKSYHTAQMGYLPEERGLYKKMKVGEQSLYLTQLKGLPYKVARERVIEWFEKFDIMSWWNKQIDELSKGMQQKIQFILTVVHNPKFFIFDEPFSGFDPINAEIIKNEFLNFKKNGCSIMLSTHNMSSVEELCDDIVLINNSKVVLQGNLTEVKNRFKKNIIELKISDINNPDNIGIENIFPENFTLLSSVDNDNYTKIKIKLPDDATPNDLLNMLLPHCRVHSLLEVLPAINDIFIQQVMQK